MTPPSTAAAGDEPEEVGLDELADIAREQRQAEADERVSQPALDDQDDDEIVEAEVIQEPAPAPTTPAAAPQVPAVVEDDEQPNLPATPENDRAVAALVPVDDEWADVDEGDLAPTARRIPYLRINRNLDGGFTIPDTGEITKELEFVWLAKAKSRTWFHKDFKATDSTPPACRSADGLLADPQSPALADGWDDVTVKPTGDCSTCPLASYDEADRGGAKRCRESVESLVFIPSLDADGNPNGGQLARMRWSGIAVRPALDYWSTFSLRMPKIPPIGFVSKATLVPTDTDYGEKLAPVFVRVRQIARAAAQPLIVERDQRVADWKADVLADAREGVDHAADEQQQSTDQRNGDVPYPDEEPF